ncbi:MAG: molybdate ABC transporter substrate-binding protein [Succinivibrio sp.]
MRKAPVQLALILLTIGSANADGLRVCSVPQAYSALENIKDYSPVKFEAYYAPSEDLLSRITNQKDYCQLVISDDERLPVVMLRTGKTKATNIRHLVKARLILWSKDPALFAENIDAVTKKKLKSLAIPKASLTPVGFAASEITERKSFPTDYLKHHIYRADHEYQAFALVDSGNVQAGFITRPLIYTNGIQMGSYWNIPEDYYSPIYYCVTLLGNESNVDALKLYNFLNLDAKVIDSFRQAGFDSL